ncbi:bifunctional phosphoribosyl-AMP cyclohydrolase/phosphoribosyl-ATP diphosphatase HisIE [archaeon]|nr:MAG: bifunctional phosphoribosyl-AMP cyclohydrolase/phosphoribosyl-ATP diphosphatase HisIE [archaeon]
MIIPSIDLMDGKAVQLVQGREKKLERDDVIELARTFRRYGEIAVIDLDAAMGRGDNIETIKEIMKVADCRVGGGIRTVERATELLKGGATRIIIGTAATPEFLSNFRKEDVIVAIDSRKGLITDKGWQHDTGVATAKRIDEVKDLCGGFLFTNVEIEGKMEGVDLEVAREIRAAVPDGMSLTVAGGITTVDEVRALEEMGADSQIGMAVYTGALSLTEAMCAIIDFDKSGGLVPTIVQDTRGTVLMMAYSSPASLARALDTGRGTYYSRSRARLWVKGEESGNTQELLAVRYDCDRDTLLFTVQQKGVACHTGSYSCFGDKGFELGDLYETLMARVASGDEGSYTYRLSKDERAIMAKIAEESQEIINYTDRANLVWEIADITYFLLVLMASKGIAPHEIVNELRGRRK